MKTKSTILMILGMSISTISVARRGSNREGLNFGTQLRLVSQTNTIESSDVTTSQEVSSIAANPFIGYSIAEIVGLGISFTGESTSINDKSRSKLESNPIETKQQLGTLKGVSLFTKLLFARVCFLETGMGAYQSSIKTTKQTLTGGGSFSGSSESSSNSGTGYGYHVGGGLEIPMGVGFYFSSAFYWRQVKLTDYLDPLQKINLYNSKNEIQFGIINYLQ